MLSGASGVVSARRFLAAEYHHSERPRLIRQGGVFYVWDGTCWPTVEDALLENRLYMFFEHKVYISAEKLMSYAPTKAKIGNLTHALSRITHLPR